jgi:hypothetical protein
MNKLVSITLLLLIIAPNGNAQKHHESKDVIQNFVRVEPKLYACKFETSNADYQAFLEDIIQRRPELKYTLILDTAKWRNEKSVNKKLQKKRSSS